MTKERRKNEIIQMDAISSEQHLRADNRRNRNSMQNDTDSEFTNVIRDEQKSSIPPEHSSHRTGTVLVSFILFTILIMIVGILIVCLKQLQPPGKTCTFVLISTSRNSINHDSRPHSVAIVDFNKDGLLDIVVPNSGTNNIGVFLRNANGTFTNQMIYSTGPDSIPYAVVVTDFNNDQQLDIAVANFGSHNIGIFLGIGNGTFKSETTFSTGSSRPRSITVSDFNNDIRPDIAIINYGTDSIGVFLQDNNGSFINQTSLFTGYDSDPYSLIVGDLNNDDQADIVVANYGTNNVGIFLGNGNGTFAIQIILNMGIDSHPYSIAIDNLNNDTYLDIVVACSGTNNVAVLLGYGDGSFEISKMYSTGYNSLPVSVVIADLDNDNKLDIAVANFGIDSIVVLIGDGNGYFLHQNETFFTSSNFNPYAIGIGDFNGDNRSDIAVVNSDFNYVDIILNYRNFSFHSQTTYPTYDNSNPQSVAIADLNNDNQLDIIVANNGDDNIGIFLGYGYGYFSMQTTYSTSYGSGPCAVAIGDFNNDSQPDIVVTNYWIDNIGVFLGYGDGTFSNQTTFYTGSNSEPFAIATGDVNNDNSMDIIVVNFGSDNIGVFLGDNNGTFSDQVTYSTGSNSGPHSVTIGDFNKDNRLDIIVANYWAYNVGVFLGRRDGSFSNQDIYSTGYDSRPSSVAFGDFNSDNQSDIIVANYGTSTLSLFLGNGNGTFSNNIILSIGASFGPWSITIGDFNHDNRLDVIVANPNSDNLGVLLGYGNGSFSSEATYSTGSGSSPWAVAVADLDNDTMPDIVVANYGTSNVGLFFGDGNSSFLTQVTMLTAFPSSPRSVAVGDFNADGQLDITVANFWSDSLGIFLGYADGTFSSQTSYYTGFDSYPYAVAVDHFSNDTQLDIVVTKRYADNIGVFLGYGNGTFSSQTTFLTGENSQPAAIATDDLNNDNRPDIAVANYGAGNIGIFLGHGDGTFASQVTYSTGDWSLPNSIAIGDFNNDSELDIVVANSGSNNIGVFLGNGNGTFSNQTTYSTSKGNQPIDATIGDLNNDGRLDIVVTLQYGFGILVFLGNGDGTLSRQLLYSTGSQSQPYPCALADVNNDNRLDVVVGNLYNGNIVVLLGHGDGTFSTGRTYSTGTYDNPESIVLGDFNHDKILDIVVANNETNTIGVFLGFTYINGVREATCSTGSSTHPRAIALADFNKDAQLDIFITNYGLDNVEVLLQDVNKTFSTNLTFPTGVLSLPTSVAASDFNNDSKLDIIVANSGSQNIGVIYGYGNSSFTPLTTFESGSNSIPESVAVGDFNNDKMLDIVVADSGIEGVRTLLRYDVAAFSKQTVYSTGTASRPMGVAVGDLNNDDRLDFVVANGDSDNIGVFLGLGNAIFSSETTYSTGTDSYPRYVTIADLTNDNFLDIVVCNYWAFTIGIFFGFGDGTFSDQIMYTVSENSGPSGSVTADFNNDGQLDIVAANYYCDNIGILFGFDNDTFSNVTYYSTTSGSLPTRVAVGDFNNDDRLDIVVTNVGIHSVGVFIGYGDGTFSFITIYSTGRGSAPISIVVGDFNIDRRLDIATTLSGTNNIGVLFGNGDGTFSSPTTFSTGRGSGPYSLTLGDFNNDNQLDIAISYTGSNSFGVLLACANGTFCSPLNYFILDGASPNSIAAGDFNNDNRLDIIVTNTFVDSASVFLGYVSESFLNAPLYSTGTFSSPTSIAVEDFDGDSRLDVVVANTGTNNIMILFGSGYGTFVNNRTYSTGNSSYPSWVAIGDLNNDNRSDIVVANSGTDNIGIFLSNGTGTFSSQITYSTGLASQPHSVAILDFDNDTHLDIAVANYGSNSIGVFFGYGNGSFMNQLLFNTGFDSHPYALAVGDVNNDNLTDIVATNDGYGNIEILFKKC